MADGVTRWWWVRHAPVVDHGDKIYGQRDVPCDTSDATAFAGLAAMLPDDAVWIVSHLSRTSETARAIRDAGLAWPEPIVEPDLAEQNFGDWQQKTWDELHRAGGSEYRAFWDDPGHCAAPGGESFIDLRARVATAVARHTEQYGGRDIIAVSHGGVIRAALSVAQETEPLKALAVQVDNLTLTRLDHIADGMFKGQGGTWRVAGVNLPAGGN
ncbi:MAG: histidine phosphatase family protein [Alphaproteobacteria bacterium]